MSTVMHFRRHQLRRTIARVLLVVFVVLNTLDVLHVRQSLARRDLPSTSGSGVGAGTGNSNTKERVFIASIFWNNEALLRNSWNPALLNLIDHLGASNVYVSIHEGGSWDRTKEALKELDEALEQKGVQRSITTSNVTHLDEVSRAPGDEGWVETPQGKIELRRIPYLAKQRNIGLKTLEELADQGIKFDKVLFINDVVFSTEDATELLSTNSGEYAAACSMDFKHPPDFYDTFALRDSNGDEYVMPSWPYFRSYKSRKAMKANRPAPVTSCWNGMVSMPAHIFTGSSALRFRGIADSLAAAHVEGSECCLIHADNPLSRQKGVFVNPKVRVAYSADAYEAVQAGEGALSSPRILLRLWENRIRRWTTTSMLKARKVAVRVRKWEAEEKDHAEPGGFCLINEMQVLREIGWAHV